jgi:Rrf2 family protein
VRLSAKGDYAVRALVELAIQGRERSVTGDRLAAAQRIPAGYLENILGELRRSGLVASQRGADGGYRLARPAAEITVADAIRAVEGPIAAVQGVRPEQLEYEGTAKPLREVWVAARAGLRSVLEHVTIADIAAGALPDVVTSRTADPDAWQ